jgi:hypothetical protein
MRHVQRQAPLGQELPLAVAHLQPGIGGQGAPELDACLGMAGLVRRARPGDELGALAQAHHEGSMRERRTPCRLQAQRTQQQAQLRAAARGPAQHLHGRQRARSASAQHQPQHDGDCHCRQGKEQPTRHARSLALFVFGGLLRAR